MRRIQRNTEMEVEEVDKEFDDLVAEIESYRQEFKDALLKRKNCPHENYHPASYTFQRRIFGHYVYVYERFCADCGKGFSVKCDSMEDAPDWGKDATQRYYNNDI